MHRIDWKRREENVQKKTGQDDWNRSTRLHRLARFNWNSKCSCVQQGVTRYTCGNPKTPNRLCWLCQRVHIKRCILLRLNGFEPYPTYRLHVQNTFNKWLCIVKLKTKREGMAVHLVRMPMCKWLWAKNRKCRSKNDFMCNETY